MQRFGIFLRLIKKSRVIVSCNEHSEGLKVLGRKDSQVELKEMQAAEL